MSVLICGSLAYDTIMVFPGRFRNEILPDKVHILNVAFLVPEMRREYGGCAGNIAYNLKLLDSPGLPMGTAGSDFGPYADRLDALGIPRTHIREIPDTFTAQAYIVTDLDDNQITAFHPGAMNHAHVQDVPRAGVELGIVAPDGKEGMLRHAQQFAEAGIPFVFDPGQGLPMFDGRELRELIERADYVTVNDYESGMLAEKTGWDMAAVAGRVKALIVTRGAQGSHIHVGRKRLEIPCAKPEAVKDPTGCGDAYRAGLLYGLSNGMDWETTGRVAALMGAVKVERHGTQNHRFTPESFRARFESEFGYAMT